MNDLPDRLADDEAAQLTLDIPCRRRPRNEKARVSGSTGAGNKNRGTQRAGKRQPTVRRLSYTAAVMGKRSRDASSPTAEDSSSPATGATSSDADQAPPSKLVIETDPSVPAAMMKCSLPPHRESRDFDSLEAFDVHYQQEHVNRCAECGRNLPSAHFLGLHIEETHNPLREALQERGERTYACFLPDCDRKCSTRDKRRLHLIDKHGFPRSYNFGIIYKGIDKATSMLKEGPRRRISTSGDATQSIGHRRRTSSLVATAPPPKESNQDHKPSLGGDMDDLERSMSALRFVPPSVTRRQGKKS